MSDSIDRRRFLGMAAVSALAAERAGHMAEAGAISLGEVDGGRAVAGARRANPLLTGARDFVDVSRGNPRPHTLKGEALARARLTPRTWRLEIVSDGSSEVARPCRLEDGTAIDLAALEELGRSRGVKYLKAMQCNNIPSPLGQGLWEGVPLREVLGRVGPIGNVRRVYYWGFHNNDPAQLFQSSLPFNRAMETPPWEPPPMLAYRLNGEEIPPERGGPVRMVVPWAHGFKSIKWLHRIVLTNDYKANDTYALQNNDPESYLKTAAYLGKGESTFKAGEPIEIEGTAMAGWSGLRASNTGCDRGAAKAPRSPTTTPRGTRPSGVLARSCRLPTIGTRSCRPARPPGPLGLRPGHGQAPELAVAVQHGPVDGPTGGAQAGIL